MCFARLVTNYWRHSAWRPEGQLLAGVSRIAHIPAVLVHGRLDLSCPPDVAWKLVQAWPAASLHIVPGIGHSSGGAIADHVVTALDHFVAGLSSRLAEHDEGRYTAPKCSATIPQVSTTTSVCLSTADQPDSVPSGK
jgi:hypothetical protein